MKSSTKYDVVVVGAGHAGCEAALASARMGLKTVLVTMHLDRIAQMSCNPAIGGLAKGQIVRETDALGGEMAKITDISAVQFRMLNLSRGPAVWSPRAQCDRMLYHIYMKRALEKQSNLSLLQAEATRLIVKKNKVSGLETNIGKTLLSKSVILTTGTFLKGLIHVGLTHFEGGRFDEFPSNYISESLRGSGFEIGRLKTGTPPRINARTVDFAKMEAQNGDNPPRAFSHFTDEKALLLRKQLPCFLTYTNKKTHGIIRKNLNRSPLYTGIINSIGPRYCPSIEDKVVRFSQRDRHQVFLEPEGYDTSELYANGIASSLPLDVQEDMVHSIKGLEKAEIMRYAYAIEYDYCPPTQLKSTLETKNIENLYFAGQINGTTGYEEAAGQGIIAGINAALKIKEKEPFILKREESYIGVLIDDLVTKGVDEPYRMFTSRAEYRLSLRNDNADLRLMEYGRKLGLISDSDFKKFEIYRKAVSGILSGKNYKMPKSDKLFPWTEEKVKEEAAIEKKYSGYISIQKNQVAKLKKFGDKKIPEKFDYNNIPNLLAETKQKLGKIRPLTLGQASRIPGVTPSDVAVLLVYLKRKK